MPQKKVGIKADGMNYTFVPGENGSLTAFPINQTPPQNPLDYTPKVKAKSISIKGREGIVKTLTASARG